jgi:hypothetical protein
MFRRSHWSAILFLGLALSSSIGVSQDDGSTGTSAASQAAPDGVPLKLTVSRGTLKNFLEDSLALIPYQDEEGTARPLRDAFMIGSPDASFAAIWDPTSCRLLGILDLTAPPVESNDQPEAEGDDADEEKAKGASPYLLLAEGPFPLSNSPGAVGVPKYFGFRLVENKPEFLYTHGSLAIEERIWLESGGAILKQRISVRNAADDISVRYPASWKARITVAAGEWDGESLEVSAEDAEGLVLTYRLKETGETGEEGEP